MFKEFAIDPNSIVNSFIEFKYVVEKFGMHQGRLIAEFPGKWKRMVYDAAEAKHTGTTELTRIVEYLSLLKGHKNIFLSKGRHGDYPEKKWIDTALLAHEKEPFDFIVSEHAKVDPLVIALNEFDENNPCLADNRQWNIRRDAVSIAETVSTLSKFSKKIKIIDPYFDLGVPRYRRPFEEILKSACNAPSVIDIFRSDRKGLAELFPAMDRVATKANQRGIGIRLFLRPAEAMHNRYVLTDRGGVTFSTGLDDDDFGNGTSHDDVTLLDPLIRMAKWDEYDDQVPVAEWLLK
ncbi:hypothetical protein [Undibacterium sp.]|uniref:hypothetical protein n=1 Tax=Undibacterium sp. TaxID=1914977 RepID=UPI0025EBC60A|nr:hypothetical protein [Undibacterium sp.]